MSCISRAPRTCASDRSPLHRSARAPAASPPAPRTSQRLPPLTSAFKAPYQQPNIEQHGPRGILNIPAAPSKHPAKLHSLDPPSAIRRDIRVRAHHAVVMLAADKALLGAV